MASEKMAIRLGAIQLAILQFLWKNGESTAREITDGIFPQTGLAHSTVQTLLRKLEVKRAVDHVERDRKFYFRATVEEGQVSRDVVGEFIDRAFSGSAGRLAAHLVENESLTPDDLKRLRALVDKKLEKDA